MAETAESGELTSSRQQQCVKRCNPTHHSTYSDSAGQQCGWHDSEVGRHQLATSNDDEDDPEGEDAREEELGQAGVVVLDGWDAAAEHDADAARCNG